MTNHNQVIRPGEVTAGEGYRLLESGELVQDGDEYFFAGNWLPSQRHSREQHPLYAYRRPVCEKAAEDIFPPKPQPEFIDLQPGMQITIPIETTDLSRILDALDGDNPDQSRIAEVGLSLVAMVLRKNTDYQNSAWQVPRFAKHLDARTAILVRMGDKVARLERILANDAQVTDEPVEATVSDLAGYAVVLLAAPKETGQ